MRFTRPVALLVLAVLAAAAPAQERPEGAARGNQAETDKLKALRERQNAEKGAADDEAAAIAANPEKAVPLDATRHGATGFCRFDAAIVPKRLMPGQTGTMLVTMVLEGDSVMPSPAPLSVKAFTNGGMQAGSWSIRPAQQAKVAKAFEGQQAYDNWAVIEMPVTMATTAQVGSRQSVTVELEFELVSGSNGAKLGKFDNRLSVTCEVGLNANPVVAAAAQPPSQPAAPQPQASHASPEAPKPSGASASPAIEVETPVAAPAPAPAAHREPVSALATEGPHDLVPSEGGSPTYYLIGGAGLLLVLALLLLRRR